MEATEKEITKRFLSRKEAAKAFMISLPTLHAYTKRGLVKAHRVGNRVLYKPEEIENALREY